METQIEIWKPIIGYEGHYEVSSHGRVRSLKFGKEKILKPGKNKYGYLFVDLSKGSKQKNFRVNRLVALAFIPNPDNLPQVNHKDEDKTNNCVDNLEWCTTKYNVNYGTAKQRRVQTLIDNGNVNPSHVGLSKKEQIKMWKQEHQEQIKEYYKIYCQEHKEQIKEKKKQKCKQSQPVELSLFNY